MRIRTLWNVAATLMVVMVIGVITFFGMIYSGVYDIAASDPHTSIMRWTLSTAQERSVRFHARGVDAPPLDDAGLVRRGVVLYREYCLVCHGAPGQPRERVGVGLNPNPPPLVEAAENWSTAEIYWITANGLKMAGMPAFTLGEEPGDLWAITAFVRRMNTLSPREYDRMVAAAEGAIPADRVAWLEDEAGAESLRTAGDPRRGRRLIDEFGCGQCHVVPGIRGARGRVGPPLTHWSDRHYIAGAVVNTPPNLVRWIVDPDAIEPGTAMPDLGVTPEQALDIAAYLYTLGESRSTS